MRMKLTDAEKAMLDGAKGKAHAKAMELLVRYGEALGAERLVETGNVCGTWGAATPFMRDFALRKGGLDAVFSEFNLDSDEVVSTPDTEVHSCQLIQGMYDGDNREFGVTDEIQTLHDESQKFFGKRGVQQFATCTPYQVGNVPVKGEHCAWMESSAVVYCNGVLGARTNTEGRESTGAASITGRIPYWGYHTPEFRLGSHLVDLEIPVESMMGWGLLGYYLGEVVQDEIPVIQGKGLTQTPNLIRLKHFGAAGASSGGIEMFHVVGVTPEAPTREAAFGPKKPKQHIKYGAAERKIAYDNLNSSANERKLDFVMLGCPHDSIEQVWLAAKLLEGRKLHPDTALWVHTPRAIKEIADRNGYTKMINDAGGRVMADTCPAISRVLPRGAKVTATDSAKQAHYLPAITGVQTWFGSLEDCVASAISGRWEGKLA
jgi:predicted aconitase